VEQDLAVVLADERHLPRPAGAQPLGDTVDEEIDNAVLARVAPREASYPSQSRSVTSLTAARSVGALT
jgi:hypothetical protein